VSPSGLDENTANLSKSDPWVKFDELAAQTFPLGEGPNIARRGRAALVRRELAGSLLGMVFAGAVFPLGYTPDVQSG
jgi:hypothetical protein